MHIIGARQQIMQHNIMHQRIQSTYNITFNSSCERIVACPTCPVRAHPRGAFGRFVTNIIVINRCVITAKFGGTLPFGRLVGRSFGCVRRTLTFMLSCEQKHHHQHFRCLVCVRKACLKLCARRIAHSERQNRGGHHTTTIRRQRATRWQQSAQCVYNVLVCVCVINSVLYLLYTYRHSRPVC